MTRENQYTSIGWIEVRTMNKQKFYRMIDNRISGNDGYAAIITGTDDKYGFEREFISDDDPIYRLKTGVIIETSDKHGRKEWWMVGDRCGKVDMETVEAFVEKADQHEYTRRGDLIKSKIFEQ